MKPSLKIGAALAFCAAVALAPRTTLAQPVPATIRSLAVQAAQAAATPTGPYDERGWLDRFYAPRKYAPAWTTSTAGAALWVLRQARVQGLDPRDYSADTLQRQLLAGDADTARFDVALTAAMLRYLADLRVGRVRSEYHTRLPDARLKQYDPVERLRGGLAAGKLQAAVQAAEPQFGQYGQVRAALAHYRELAGQPWPVLAKPQAKVAPGGAYADAKALYKRLVLLGDLPAETPPPPDGIYGARMKEGVRRFQARHGLDEDGVLGRLDLCFIKHLQQPRHPLTGASVRVDIDSKTCLHQRLSAISSIASRRKKSSVLPMVSLISTEGAQSSRRLAFAILGLR